ncbi:AsmA-like C-terminal region-containing protein [Tautonia sociabilis]|uniref:AsmA family protein n=1 Tax=Tautonia sociabilis TaxID=2080755 RepID=A0A432MMK8_9BACT|nr:AsmA-like C-terminal region-containing protein [Tautonia sociabilis]RUL88673.1 AsmA family protein [Tautonia sociabilis]
MPDSTRRSRWTRHATLPLILLVGLGFRLLAAAAVQLYTQQKGLLGVFGDTTIYWALGEAIRTGAPYVVEQWGQPHFALRTPGYPAFLAACQAIFGEHAPLGARAVQAGLGAVSVGLVYGLVVSLWRGGGEADRRRARSVATVAAALAAVEPYTVGLSALLLSEALFVPLMLAALWGLAVLWRRRPGDDGEPTPPAGPRGIASAVVAVLSGLAIGGAILVRPSWAAVVPVILLAWVLSERSGRAIGLAALVAVAVAGAMAPWWIRNERVIGRFVPTALWVGASLYDGLSPEATGASDMAFLEDPAISALGEVEQDRELRRRAVAFAREHPGRALRLAAIKVARFWSPWPNADELSAPGVEILSGLATIPVFLLLAVGVWDRRRDPRALVLLLGTLVSFCVLHAVFVSSIRYRLPGMVPALGLAAAGLVRLVGGRFGRDTRKMVAWAVVLPVSVLVGGGWYAVGHATDGSELARLVEREAVRLLPGSVVQVGRVTLRPIGGSAALEQVRIYQRIEGLSGPTVEVGYVRLQFDVAALLRKQFRPKEVVVAQPTLRLGLRPDGSWNLQGMLADPWPLPPPDALPTILVRSGTLLFARAEGVVAVLRDVAMKLEPISEVVYRLEGSARGDGFERLDLAGTFDTRTGRVTLSGGELVRLELGDALAARMPEPWRPAYQKLALSDGELDVRVRRLVVDPSAPAGPLLDHEVDLLVRSGTWSCPELPFPLSEVELLATLRAGALEVEHARGINGRTTVRAAGSVDATDPVSGPMDLLVEVTDLELDDRLRAKTPPDVEGLWTELSPGGRTHVYARIARRRPRGEVGIGLTLDLQDVSITCAAFPYPLEHLSGQVVWEGDRVTIPPPGLATVIGNRPARCWGTIDEPGEDCVVALDFEMGALPIDETLLGALAPDVRQVLRQFQPKGTVRVAHARFERRPPDAPGSPESVALTATLDLGEPAEAGGFAFTWEGLPYPITNVKGRLVITPERWEFHDLVGYNGLARIECPEGWVRQSGPNAFDAELSLSAEDLPFDEQLRRALPPEWQETWRLLNPTGKASLDSSIRVVDNVNHTRMAIRPDPGTSIRLKFTPAPIDPGGPPPPPLELPAMEGIDGTFVYDDGLVTMDGVAFHFRGSPVRFRSGLVELEPDGRFGLSVTDLRVARFRLDSELRKLMPSVMAEFARRLDESPAIPSMRGDLRLGWSGRLGDPAFVEWENGLVVLDGQTIRAGVVLEAIHGRLAGVSGRFDGRRLALEGLVDLDSLTIAGQQITRLRSPLVVDGESAALPAIEGNLLGGRLTGQVRIGLDEEPDYAATLAVQDAELARFTASLPGKQSFRGLLSGMITFRGAGPDPRSITGSGDLRIREGDLGDLPVALRFVKVLNTLDIAAPGDATAFDSAEVSVRIENGLAYLDPIRLSGDAISLRGGGTMDLRGQLDLRLRLVYGRDGLRIPLLSDAFREAGGQIADIRVTGPASFPLFRPEVLPGGRRVLQSLGSGVFNLSREERPALVR